MPNTKTTNNQTAKSHLISKNFSLNLFSSTCQRKNCTKITEAVASVASMDQNLPFEQTHFFLTSVGWERCEITNVKRYNERRSGTLRRQYKKLSYHRGTAHCVLSVEILPIATQQCRNYTCTTSPEQIEVMELEGYSGTMCNKHVHSNMTRSSRFYCPVGVINKPTTVEL